MINAIGTYMGKHQHCYHEHDLFQVQQSCSLNSCDEKDTWRSMMKSYTVNHEVQFTKNRKGSGQDIRPRRITKMVHVFNMQQDKEQTAKGLEHSSSLQQPAFYSANSIW
jgi:hypothetical protein